MTAPPDSRRPAPNRPGKREPRGDTRAARGGRREPRLPHERDESSDSQVVDDAQSRKVMKQAADDLDNGLVDTDRGAVTERLAREHFPPSPPAPPRKRRR